MDAPAASSPPVSATPPGGPGKLLSRAGFGFLAVALLSLLPYLAALQFGFVYDDDVQVVENPLLRSWSSFGAIFSQHSWSFLYSGVQGGYYRPVFLTWLSLNYHLFGLRPAGWHFTSLLLHGTVSGLLFLLLRRHGFAPWIAFVAALGFGLDPVHVEPVAWISGATDLLAAAALLASLLCWCENAEGSSPYRPPLVASLVFYSLALLAKETAIVFPAIVFVYASVDSPSRGWRRYRRAGRRALPFAGAALVYLALRRTVLASPAAALTLAGLKTTVATAPALVLFYLRHLVWPADLSLFYNFSANTDFSLAAFLYPLAVLALLAGAAVWLALRFSGQPLPALAWLFLPLLPVLWAPFFAAGDLAHDRYLYLPSIGLALLAGQLLAGAAARLGNRTGHKILAAAVLLLLAGATAVESRPWQSDFALYSHACRSSPAHPIGCNNLAVALIARGDYRGAREILQPMLGSPSNASRINGNFGISSYRLSDYGAAEDALRRATDLDPSYADAYLYLGLTCYRTKREPEAESLVRRALSLDPAGLGYHAALGSVLMAESKFAQACEEFRAELRQRPDLQAATNLLHDCERRSGPGNPGEVKR